MSDSRALVQAKRRGLIWAVGVYAVLTLLITYPVGFRLSSALAGVEGEDVLQHVWIAWWTQEALIDLGLSPADVTLLYHPDGTCHPMLWVTPYPQIAALPLSLLFGPVVGHNLHLLLSFPLSGLSAYLLIRYLTKDEGAAFIGGLIFAFFPARVIQSTAHFAQVVIYPFPLYALYLFRLYHRPRSRNAVLCGLFLALSLAVNIVHIAYFVLPFTVLFFVYHLYRAWREPRSWPGPRFLKGLSLAGGIAFLLSGPFLGPFVFRSLTGRLTYLSMSGVVDYSIDLLAFFTPSPFHPLFRGLAPFRAWATSLIGRGNPQENIAYLGLVPLVLAVWGFRRRPRQGGVWLLLGLTATVICLGPVLKVGGLLTGLPLPYALLQLLPFYKWGRVPGRASVALMLAVAVLAGYGLKAVVERRRDGIVPILAILIVLEYLTIWPFPTMPAAVPEFCHRLAGEKDNFAVLDVPQWPVWLRRASNYAMYYQTVHQHPMVGGYVWRLPEGREGTMKAFQELVLPPVEADIIVRPTGDEAVRILNQYYVKYVILHKGVWEAEDEAEAIQSLTRLLGPPFYDDPQAVAFAVPVVEDGPGDGHLLALSYNWYNVEMVDGQPARWLKNDGAVYVHLQSHLAEGRYRLSFAAYPFAPPRRLQVLVNGQPVADEVVEGWRKIVTPPFDLQKGGNTITFHVAEGCQVPAEVEPASQDRRCLSLMFQDIRLLPAETSGGP